MVRKPPKRINLFRVLSGGLWDDFDDEYDEDDERPAASVGDSDPLTVDAIAQKMLPQCKPCWMESIPAPLPLFSDFEDMEAWVEKHGVLIDLDIHLGDLLQDKWYRHFDPRIANRRELPTLRDLADPKIRTRWFYKKERQKALLADLTPAFAKLTLFPAVRNEMTLKFEKYADEIASSEMLSILKALWEKISTSGFSFSTVDAYRFAGGIESGAPLYQFGAEQRPPFYYNGQTVVSRIGLWPDSPDNILLSCSCGGRIDRPCGHLHTALERLFEGILNKEHPGNAALAERLSLPPWHATLRTITSSPLFAEVEGDGSQSIGAERVTWRIVPYGTTWKLTAAVQTLGKNGRWSKGRKIEPGRLKYEHDFVMTDKDYRIVHAERSGALQWMRELLGHSLVFADESADLPIHVMKSELQISVAKEGDFLRLGFTFGGRYYHCRDIANCLDKGEGVVGLLDSKAGCFFFSAVTRRELNLIDLLADRPTRIPSDGLPEVLEALCNTKARVPVHIDKALRGDTVEPNLRPVIRLTPAGETSLSITLGFHLFDDGFWSIPGEGAETMVRSVKGRPLTLSRDFAREQQTAKDLASALNLDELQEGALPFDYLAVTVDDTVNLLTLVRSLSTEHTVEWPTGKTPWTVSDINTHNTQIRIAGKKGALFEIGLNVQIDDTTLSIHDIAAALESGSKYVALGPGRFAKIAENLRAAAENISAVSIGRDRQLMHISKAAAAALMERLSEPDLNVAADEEWRGFAAKLDAVRLQTPTVPDSFQGELRDYQREGFLWMSRIKAMGFGACLADDMGLGKTVQALALLAGQQGSKPSLVVAPTSVAPNWMREAYRFVPSLEAVFHHGALRNTDFSRFGKEHLIITTYDILNRDIDALSKIPFETMIIDEAQVVKNAATKRAAAVREIDAETKIALTGTPIENHLGELWSIFDAVVPGLLGSLHQFSRRFAVPIQKHGREAHRQRLAALIRPFVLRRTKLEAAPELPPRTETVRFVELYEEERNLYEIVRRAVLAQLESGQQADLGEKDRFNILAQITKLRRMACHPKLNDPSSKLRSAKLDTVEELIDDILRDQERALVFSQFVGHLELLRARLDEKKISYFYLDGSTPANERGRLMDAWLLGEGSLFLISLKAGGTGLNLMGADYVLHLDPWWNPAVEDQATDRTHRIGQTKPVTVVRVIASATIEEAVIALHDKKRDLAESVLSGTGKAGALSADELIDLIRTGDDVLEPKEEQ
jgi:hypothetical protein